MNKEIEYRIGCIDHFGRAENLLKNSLYKENKFYAALELRYSIERFLFEWLFILKYKVYDITKKR
jgi:hypothetical protein